MRELSGDEMARATVRGAGVPPVAVQQGESLAFGRAPHDVARPGPGRTLLTPPDCAPHVSRLVGELRVGTERVVLHWVEPVRHSCAVCSTPPAGPGGSR